MYKDLLESIKNSLVNYSAIENPDINYANKILTYVNNIYDLTKEEKRELKRFIKKYDVHTVTYTVAVPNLNILKGQLNKMKPFKTTKPETTIKRIKNKGMVKEIGSHNSKVKVNLIKPIKRKAYQI